jgi:hypothetical protein
MVEHIFALTCVMGMIYSKGNNRTFKVIIVIKDQEDEELV